MAVGGGAGALGRAVASAMGLEIVIPPKAEVISAVGDALSLIRAERERTFERPSPADVERLVTEVEGEAIAAGASASSIDVRVEQLAERSAVRVVVTGAVALNSGAVPGRQPATSQEAADAAADRGYDDIEAVGQFWIARANGRKSRVAVLDRYADLTVEVDGVAVRVAPDDPAAEQRLADTLSANLRRVGPVTIPAEAWVVSGSRFLQVPDPQSHTIVETVQAVAPGSDRDVVIVVGRE